MLRPSISADRTEMDRTDDLDSSERTLHDFVCPGMRAVRLFNLQKMLLRTRGELGVAQNAISKNRDDMSKAIEELEKELSQSRKDVSQLKQELKATSEKLDRFIRSQTVPFADPLCAPTHLDLDPTEDYSDAGVPNDTDHGHGNGLLCRDTMDPKTAK